MGRGESLTILLLWLCDGFESSYLHFNGKWISDMPEDLLFEKILVFTLSHYKFAISNVVFKVCEKVR